jgi:demethylmenaquinone methyltransferase/2-methoxy-6-polyprenyl-1,4-benzoquinol methylase
MGVVDERMRAYYDRRAPEYDDWWLGEGLFARRQRPGWREEVETLIDTVARLPAAHTLDVACGTGFLTRHLRGELAALDQSAEMLAIAAARVPRARIVKADAVPLPFVDGEFDRVFTSHFYGHLLPAERSAFLAEAGRVGSELVVVDSARRDGVEPEERQERVLNDGSRHTVYKRFFTAEELAGELGGNCSTLFEGSWFVAVTTAAAV